MKNLKLLVIFIFLLSALMFKSFLSTPVKSQTGIAAPTNLTASDGAYNNKVGLNWDAMRGASLYRVFRNTTDNPATAAEIGTTAAASFFDASAVAGQTYFYWVRAENGSIASGLSLPEQGFHAVGTQQGPVPPLEPPLNNPPANPVTATKATLGKTLFWDEQLSSTRTVSCGTCHSAGKGGSDSRTIVNNLRSSNPGFDTIYGTPDDVFGSPGVPLNNADGTYSFSPNYGLREQVTGRKSNSFINAVYAPLLFWDGRAAGAFRDPLTNAIIINNGGALESQAAGPPVNGEEMGHGGINWQDVANGIAAAKPLALSPSVPAALDDWIGGRGYPELFQEAFGTPEVTPARIIMAIATYERTLYSDRTPFDLAVAGITPLTQQEQRGRNVFNQNQCNVCHAGNLFTDNSFRYIGLRPQNEDRGRFEITGNPQDLGAFRTPSLRNVELRAPFMHNGRFQTLEEVIEFYNRGGDFPNAPNFPGNLIRPRNLSPQQKADLAAFLRRPLTDQRVAQETAQFDRPALYSDSNRVPQIIGSGTNGSGGQIPQAMAIEPPFAGNPSFTVAVTNALGGAQAVLVIDSNEPGINAVPASGSLARISTNLSGSGVGSGYGSVSLAIPNNPSIIGQTFYGRWYITDAGAANGFAVSQAFRFTVFGEASAAPRKTYFDFDGDGKSDISVFRPSGGNWHILNSSSGSVSSTVFGTSGDAPAPGDFDGDGRTDIAVYRSGVWHLLRSTEGYTAIQFGAAGDKPQPGDFDGDNKADVAVFRPGTGGWYIQQSRDGFRAVQFGLISDRPVAADYDGDGKTDAAVYRDGAWYILQSRDGFRAVQFGIAADKPVIGDYDADGKSDIAVWRPGTGFWYTLRSGDGSFTGVQFGISNDVPVPGDYDGDGKSDYAVFRSGAWYVLQSSNGNLRSQAWGIGEDTPVPSSFIP